MSEENKAIVGRFYEEVWNRRNLAVVDELYDTGYVAHNAPPGDPPGIQGLKHRVATYHAAFPDGEMTIEDQIAEGDKVVTLWTGRGTHRGELLGIPPTGVRVTVIGIDVCRIVGGQIVESWDVFDQMDLLQQLGAVPDQA